MVSCQDVGNAHDSSVLVSGFGADVEDCHGELMVEVTEAKLGPKIFFSFVTSGIPSIGLTSNSWHISLNLSLNLGSDLISFLYFLAKSLRLLWKRS